MLRIGIMLDSLSPSAWAAKIIRDIQESDFARVVLIIENRPIKPAPASFRKRLSAFWKSGLFNRYEQWDYLRNRVREDGGRVIYRGHSSTDMTSLYRNRNPVYWKTAEFATRRLRDLHTHGKSFIESLSTYSESDAYTRGIYRSPNFPQTIRFFMTLAWRILQIKVAARWLGPDEQWFVAVRRRSDSRPFHNCDGYTVLHAPKDRFYADPFLVERGGKTYLFLEDYRYDEGIAVICCSEVGEDSSIGAPVEVLRRPYHLSYPNVFEHEGDMYMIPETKQNRTVELYRATDFPLKWELDTVLLGDVYAVDATIHCADGKYWMFAGLSNGKYSNSDELALYLANDLRGPWMPHCANPVVSDVRCARPAGALFRDNGRLIRPSQNCGPAYGFAVVFSEVMELDENVYRENAVATIEPDWMPGNLGTHTYSRSASFEAIDGKLRARCRH
jgi:hypothetical protein